MRNKLLINFSGGRTSAVMTKLCLEKYKDVYEYVVVFANTGLEHEATLEYIKKCDDQLGFGTIWIEAVTTPEEGVGIRHKIVDFESASRKGEPLEEIVKKYGIPNAAGRPFCTPYLKTNAVRAFARDGLGWKSKKSYFTAIGIRADEMDRMSSKLIEEGYVYPLADAGWTKNRVLDECASWDFDLELPDEKYGNCVGCIKKSLRMLMSTAKEAPEYFDFFREMERKYGKVRAKNVDELGEKTFFRDNTSTDELIERANEGNYVTWKPNIRYSLYDVMGEVSSIDITSGCGESCEVGADE